MSLPPRFEDAVACFCGHHLFDHDEYGPCAQCSCKTWQGCLVIVSTPTTTESSA